jgi:PadR family transcriptional regulator, regulatory protein PadR
MTRKPNSLGISALDEAIMLCMIAQPRYGLEILELISEASGGKCDLNFGSLYRFLDQLRNHGLIEEVKVIDNNKVLVARGRHRRRYYTVTAKGVNILEESEFMRQRLKNGLQPSTEMP